MECNDCSQLITTLVALLTAALSGFLSYYFAVRKYRKESQENVERWKYEAIWHAHQSLYKLLRFMTDNENEDSILVFRKQEGSKQLQPIFRKDKAREFLTELTDEFYKKGNGLFLSKEVADSLFKYRHIVFGLLQVFSNYNENEVQVKNTQAVENMKKNFQQLSPEIRNSLHLHRRNLLFS